MESNLSTALSQNGVWKDRMIDLDSGSTGTNSRLVHEVGPNQEVETQVHIHFPTMECDLILVIQVQEW